MKINSFIKMTQKLVIVALISVFMGVAEAADNPASAASAVSSSGLNSSSFLMSTLTYISLGFLAFYLLIVKPTQVEDEKKSKLKSSIKKGQEVVTSGGLIGRVSLVKDNITTIEIAPKIQVKVLSDSIVALSNTTEKITD